MALDFEEEEATELVGDVPRGFVAPRISGIGCVVDNLATIGPAAIGLLLIGFSQTVGDGRAFAAKHGYRLDIDQESVAQGLSNVGSGVLRGILVSTSLSASSLNDEPGAKARLASLTTGILLVLTLLLLAPVFSETCPGMLVMHFDAGLFAFFAFFASAEALADRLRVWPRTPGPAATPSAVL